MTKQQFKVLQKKWYKKLSEKGFEDQEDENGKHLKLYTYSKFHGVSVEELYEKSRYFALARQMVWNHPFKSKSEKQIWALYADGFTFVEIMRKLKLSKEVVENTVAKLEKFITYE